MNTDMLLMNDEDEVVVLGHVMVDTAQILIADPCHIDEAWDDTPTAVALGDMSVTMAATLGECASVAMPTLTGPGGGSVMGGLGVVAPSGIGDGYYPVYAVIGEIIPGWGKRVKKIVIDFEDHPALAMLDDQAHCAAEGGGGGTEERGVDATSDDSLT